MYGKTYSEISKITNTKKNVILYVSDKGNWHDKRMVYYNDLSDNMLQKCNESKIETLNTVTTMVSALNKYFGTKYDKLLKTKDESIIEGLDTKLLGQYYKATEAVDKIIGASASGDDKDKPLVKYGDISTLRSHETKLFQTVEGGAIISKDPLVADKVSYMRNFGHSSEEKFFGVGINGKNSELHAAMGLCNLPRIEEIITNRRKISELYDYLLLDKSATNISKPLIRSGTKYNYSYYPVLFKDEAALLEVKKQLNQSDIFPRRYFYPSLDKIEYLPKSSVPITDEISKRVLCLPLYHELQEEQINLICSIILKTLNL